MKEEDIVFTEEETEKPKGEFSEGDIVIVNGEEFTIGELVDSRIIEDKLGFPANYFWYKATKNNESTNLFFFDTDIDSVEPNDKIAQTWWDEAYKDTEIYED